jgi:hypothetical protein
MPSLRHVALIALLSITVAAPRSARAEGTPTADAQKKAASLKATGDAEMDALRYTEALAAYQEAYALSEAPALLYNQGRALEALNRFPEAVEQFEAFVAKAPPELKKRVPGIEGHIGDLRKRVSTLTVTCNVPAARVIVRQTVVGKTPLPGPLKLTSGAAVVEVDADGYLPFSRAVDLPGGGAVTLDAALVAKATTGILVIEASDAGAVVSIDGTRAGVSPVEVLASAGNHRILVQHPDHPSVETVAFVTAGEKKLFRVTLLRPSLATRWWLWTSLGAAVAAGVGIGIAATTEKAHATGSILPGSGAAPLMRAPQGFYAAAPLLRF